MNRREAIKTITAAAAAFATGGTIIASTPTGTGPEYLEEDHRIWDGKGWRQVGPSPVSLPDVLYASTPAGQFRFRRVGHVWKSDREVKP